MDGPGETIVKEGQEVPYPTPRRFTLADAMLLVAVTAPGLVLLRIVADLGLFTIDPTAKSLPGITFVIHLSLAGGCVLVPMALCVLILGLRHHRATRREVIHGPGFVACLAVFIAAILPVAYFVVRVAKADELNRPTEIKVNFNNSFGRLTRGAGPMIAGAWLALALTGRWRPGPNWVEGLGCCIGGCFIIMYIYTELYYLMLSFYP